MTRAALAVLAVSACACGGHYASFTLPEPSSPAENIRWSWHAEPHPVLRRGSMPPWDSIDALNPSVISWRSTFLNVYSGFDGRTWHTLTSPPISKLSPNPRTWEGDYIAANGSALVYADAIFYWYQAGGRQPRIGFARDWHKRPEPVLETGPRGAWDERGVADPYVIRHGEWFYMFYLGQDRARRQRLGIARSQDGIEWEKLRANPILDIGADRMFDENGLGEPAVWQSHGSWWMLYTGRDRHENRRMGIARSRDGVLWERVPGLVIGGDQPWNAKVVCDPHVMVNGDVVRVWFGGGNVARPDERINGQIGYGELTASNQ
jgi:predicted GH43/DUF377 family glycosyl hydrolase